jgi:hypothetical protein
MLPTYGSAHPQVTVAISVFKLTPFALVPTRHLGEITRNPGDLLYLVRLAIKAYVVKATGGATARDAGSQFRRKGDLIVLCHPEGLHDEVRQGLARPALPKPDMSKEPASIKVEQAFLLTRSMGSTAAPTLKSVELV